RGKGRWELKIDASRIIRFEVRLDRRGWDPYLGSQFVYEITPLYRGKEQAHGISQLRLHELQEFDSSLIHSAKRILNIFASKLPRGTELDTNEFFIHL